MKIEYNGIAMPMIGEKVTMHHYAVGTCSPYTVSRIEGKKVYIRTCRLIFKGKRYWDTLPDEIVDDPKGEEEVLTWSPKRKQWIHKSHSGDRYPSVAEFGKWDFRPYLD